MFGQGSGKEVTLTPLPDQLKKDEVGTNSEAIWTEYTEKRSIEELHIHPSQINDQPTL